MENIQEKIKEWKEQHGYVYKVNAGGEDFYFRPLTRDDYIAITMKQVIAQGGFDHDKEVFKMCVLNDYDEKLLTAKGGIVTVVVEKIMIYSGFENVEVEEL
jgi:hypothetical protein